MEKGLFIVIDGIDGSGKSEIVKLLHEYLKSRNEKYSNLATREPTNGRYGRQIRHILREEKDPMSNGSRLTELFIKDRKEHLEKEIVPFLGKKSWNKKNIVICDRYYYSTISFQSAQGLDIKELIEKNSKFRKPDMAFILDVNPSTALKRIEYRQKEKFEQLNFMKKIRACFLKLPRLLHENIKIIDSSKPLNDVFMEVKKEVEKILN